VRRCAVEIGRDPARSARLAIEQAQVALVIERTRRVEGVIRDQAAIRRQSRE